MTDSVKEIEGITDELNSLVDRFNKWYDVNIFTIPYKHNSVFVLAKTKLAQSRVHLKDVVEIKKHFEEEK